MEQLSNVPNDRITITPGSIWEALGYLPCAEDYSFLMALKRKPITFSGNQVTRCVKYSHELHNSEPKNPRMKVVYVVHYMGRLKNLIRTKTLPQQVHDLKTPNSWPSDTLLAAFSPSV
jgi:hypothetical protein